jgi:DNA polymerase III delta subunit
MLNEKLNSEIKKGLPEPIYYIWGKDNFFLEETLSRLADAFWGSSRNDFNYDVFYASSNPQDILNAVYTVPFLTPRRLVILKNFHEFPKAHVKAVAEYIKKPSDSTCLVILSRSEPEKKFDISQHVYPLVIRESDIPLWLKQTAARKGFEISETAIECLIESVGSDIGMLASEINKFEFAGLKKIDDKEVLASTGVTRGYLPFDLVDALIAGQKARAFRILKSLVEHRISDAPAVLGSLNWHYRQFYSLWENKGKRPLKMRTSTYKALVKHLPSFTQKDFSDIFQTLHEADIGMKTTGRPEPILEISLIKLLRIGAKS